MQDSDAHLPLGGDSEAQPAHRPVAGHRPQGLQCLQMVPAAPGGPQSHRTLFRRRCYGKGMGVPATLVRCRPVSGTRGPWAPNRSPVVNGAQDFQEGKKVYLPLSSRARTRPSLGHLGILGPSLLDPGLSTSVEVPSVANCARCMFTSAYRAPVQLEPGTLPRGQSGLRALALPMWKMATLGRPERRLRAGSHMWVSPARPGGRRRKAGSQPGLAPAWTPV